MNQYRLQQCGWTCMSVVTRERKAKPLFPTKKERRNQSRQLFLKKERRKEGNNRVWGNHSRWKHSRLGGVGVNPIAVTPERLLETPTSHPALSRGTVVIIDVVVGVQNVDHCRHTLLRGKSIILGDLIDIPYWSALHLLRKRGSHLKLIIPMYSLDPESKSKVRPDVTNLIPSSSASCLFTSPPCRPAFFFSKSWNRCSRGPSLVT